MAGYLVLGVAVVYGATSVFYFLEDKGGLSLAFLAYAVANIGLWMAGEN